MKRGICIFFVSVFLVCTVTACGRLDLPKSEGTSAIESNDEKRNDAEPSEANDSDILANGEGSENDAASNVTPELKEFLDSYEAYIDRYIAFMKEYQDSGYSASMMNDYLAILEEYSNFTEKAESYDEDNMSDEDLAYYVEVIGRVSQKLLSASV